jgi:hypothetical protein
MRTGGFKAKGKHSAQRYEVVKWRVEVGRRFGRAMRLLGVSTFSGTRGRYAREREPYRRIRAAVKISDYRRRSETNDFSCFNSLTEALIFSRLKSLMGTF